MTPPQRSLRITPTGGERFLPRLPPGAHLLGTVQRGLQIGALVQLADRSYAQLNGDVLEHLNSSQVEHALRSALGSAHHRGARAAQQPAAPRAPPQVIVKKRRVIVPPS